MNRAQKRALAKINRSDIKAAEERIMKHQEKVLNDERVETIFCLFALALHQLYGFGAIRTNRVLLAVDANMKAWREGRIGYKDLRAKVNDEIGLDIYIS